MEWQFAKYDTEAAARLGMEMGLSPVLAGILVSRGLNDPESARIFLKPSLSHLPDPFLLPDLEKAAERLIQALNQNERIVVYGDYDADGLTAAVLMTDFLSGLGARVSTYIPHRLEEGYGLNPGAVEHLAETGHNLIVTVDCGVSDFEGISRARELGLDVIVTDHHQVPAVLPPALAVVNPQRKDHDFPQRDLAGVGVAFFMAGGLRKALKNKGLLSTDEHPPLAPALGLVAIGTIADVSPLTNVNRILVRVGLDYLARPDRPGLVSLKQVASLEPDRTPSVRDVAFRLAPRLNAAGRLGSPQPGLDLLLTRDTGQARIQADDLDRLNNQRRRLQMDTFKEAMAMLENQDSDLGMSIVLAKEGWQRGVVGLAASKLAEKFRRPAILLAIEDGLAVGSGRSIEGFNIFAALNECRDLMIRFGGHEQAAGLSVENDRVAGLAQAFENIAAREICSEDSAPVLNIDALADMADLNQGLGDELAVLAPFGQANPEPTLALTGLTVLSAGVVGSGHLKLTLGQGDQTLSTIGFNLGHLLPELGPRVCAAVREHTSVYRGRTTHGWKVVDIKKE